MSETDDIVKMMADAPEEQRASMLTQRLKMLAGQPEEQRVQSLAGLISSVTKLKPKKMKPFIATRTRILMSLAQEEKEALILGRLKAGKILDENAHKTDMMLTMEVSKEMGEDKFNMLFGMIKQIAEKHGLPAPQMEAS
ncbi:MAG: hypothetical protein ACW96U_08175 [Candidatus Heimdallarchaeaceae archaeon]